MKDKLKNIWLKARSTSRNIGLALVISALLVRLGYYPSFIMEEMTKRTVEGITENHFLISKEDLPNVSALTDTVIAQFQLARPEIGQVEINFVSSREPNAYSLPDGRIFVTLGLLARINTISQLAGILGHEIGHQQLEAYRAQFSVEMVTLGAALFFVGTGGLGTVLITIPGGFLVERFIQRQHEYGADMFAVDLMRQAGFDSSEFGAFLGTKLHTTKYTPPLDDLKELTATHPIVYKRALRVLTR